MLGLSAFDHVFNVKVFPCHRISGLNYFEQIGQLTNIAATYRSKSVFWVVFLP